MSEYLFNLTSVVNESDDPSPVTIKPNLWLVSSEEIPPLLFTTDEAAKLLHIGKNRVYEQMRRGVLRSVKVGSSRRISARALADYVEDLEAQR